MLEASWLQTFKTDHWAQAPLFTEHHPGVAEAFADSLLSSPASFLAAAPPRLKCWFAGLDGPKMLPLLDSNQALEVYESRLFTVVSDHMEGMAPQCGEIIEEIERAVGLAGEGFCNAYVSPAGRETKMHCDRQHVFVLQVAGRKEWWFEPNVHVPRPNHGVAAVEIGPDNYHLLREADRYPMPSGPSANAQRVLMVPGASLFLPRGYWHATHAHEDSLSLTFSFQVPSWRETVFSDLQAKVDELLEWRSDSFSSNWFVEPTEENFRDYEARLRSLSDYLARCRPEELSPHLLQHSTALIRPVAANRATCKDHRLTLGQGANAPYIDYPPDMEPWFSWLTTQESFTPREAIRRGVETVSLDVALVIVREGLRLGCFDFAQPA